VTDRVPTKWSDSDRVPTKLCDSDHVPTKWSDNDRVPKKGSDSDRVLTKGSGVRPVAGYRQRRHLPRQCVAASEFQVRHYSVERNFPLLDIKTVDREKQKWQNFVKLTRMISRERAALQ